MTDLTANTWQRLAPEEREAFGDRRLEDVVDRFSSAQQKADTWEVDSTSRLAEDNAATSLYRPMTHELHYLLSSALDHFEALFSLLHDGGSLRPFAPFTLIRSAIESLAYGLWLQNGGTLDSRVIRLLQFQWSQRLSATAYTMAAGIDTGPNDQHLSEVLSRTKASRKGLNQHSFTKPMKTTTDIFKEIDKGFHPPLAHAGLAAWRVCSGVTHGNVHFASPLMKSQSLDAPGRGGATKINTPTTASLALMLDPATSYLERYVQMLHAHGTARPGRPEYRY